MRRKNAVCGLVWVIGLAASAAGILLWGASRELLLDAEAADKETLLSDEASGSFLYQPGVGATWVSTTPVTTVVNNGYQVWPITQYGITITFYENSVPLDWTLFPEFDDGVVPLEVTAVFTLTPQENVSLGMGVAPLHVFDLEGRYSWGGVVSMNNVDIALEYAEQDLGGILEHTLGFYHYDLFSKSWVLQSMSLDTNSNVIECTTDETGLFAVAGNPYQLFLPLTFSE